MSPKQKCVLIFFMWGSVVDWYMVGTKRPAGQPETSSFPRPDWTRPKLVQDQDTFLRIFSGRVGDTDCGLIWVRVFFTGDKVELIGNYASHSQTEYSEYRTLISYVGCNCFISGLKEIHEL